MQRISAAAREPVAVGPRNTFRSLRYHNYR